MLLNYNMTTSINVYIDGSCVHNGQKNAKAGYGVFFKDGDPRNEHNIVVGKQSNNTGELTAFIRAIEILDEDLNQNKIIHIYTDSEYVIKCVTTYGTKLKNNNWQPKKDKVIPNLSLVKKAYELYTNNIDLIKLHHIKAHTDNEDEHSIGNSEADRLANLAIGHERCPYQNTKHYINISYDKKDAAKLLGAQWDMKEKKWYYVNTISDENKEAINQLELEYTKTKDLVPIIEENNVNNENIYLRIPFKNKDAAKKLGARWDPSRKLWYYVSNLDVDKITKLKALES